MEIVHIASEQISNFRASRGQCGTGHIFANGLIYTSPHRCVSCYPMLRGVTALSGEKDRGVPVADAKRLEVFTSGQPTSADSCEQNETKSWPMYRHNPLRTNTTATPLPRNLSVSWTLDLKERASAPTVAGGLVFLSIVNEGRVCAVDAESGEVCWTFVAGARVDTPPTIYGERCFFGCHDGWVYCLSTKDGSPQWRYNAAPEHRRIVAYDRVESPWPVLGSVLLHDGLLYALAGRLTRSDGGMYLVALNPMTGTQIWRKHLSGIYGREAHILPQSWHANEEHFANNVLLANGDALRLYDEFGTWQFDCETGEMTGRSHKIPQPGWPRGRLTPPNAVAAERWPWAGWDRVTAAELLAGSDTYNMMAHGMHPFARSTPKYQAWQFPSRDQWGIHGTRLNKEKQFVIAPAKFTERHLDVEQMPWKPRTIDLDVKSYVFADAGRTVVIAGGKPIGPHHTSGELRTIDMRVGRDLSVVPLPAPVNFDGVAVANGRVFATTIDGKLICVGEK
jgi:outer membrane protein assembly factor BamB